MVFINFLLLAIHFTLLSIVNGCGPLQAGRERVINFTVTNFKLPAVMVYSTEPADKMRVPSISTSQSEVETFVQRLIMQPVVDVLYQQGRSAFLPDSVISQILQQLKVQITYEPLKCDNVVNEPYKAGGNNGAMASKLNCIIIKEAVTSTCMHMTPDECSDAAKIVNNLMPIDPKHLKILGSLKTSNGVMANWSSQMWQSVLNRVLRQVTSEQYASYFFGASVNIG